MTTALTVQDIIDAIDSEPEMLEALRARLLSRELLELPERFAEFQKSTLKFQANTLEFQKSMTEFQANTLEFQKSSLEFQANTDRQFVELRTDVGMLKGWVASRSGLGEIPLIVDGMGYEYSRLLERVELIRMARRSDTSGIERSVLESFIRADAVAEVADEEGRSRYVAIEISFTAQKNDVDRAVRNAEFITRFTGVPASAAVAGLRMADEARGDVESGNVFWHELPASIMQAE